MRNRQWQFLALAAGIALAGTARAGTIKAPARRSAQSTSAHRAMVGSRSQGKHPGRKAAPRNSRKRGQRQMAARRVRQIQAALIREHYLKGRPNGVWDQRSKQAMARFQADNRWQAKVVPDSRALIKLGLGPNYAGLINPETAVISFLPHQGTPASPSP